MREGRKRGEHPQEKISGGICVVSPGTRHHQIVIVEEEGGDPPSAGSWGRT